MITVTVVGLRMGNTMRQNTCQILHPSMMAASSSETGTDDLTNPWNKNTPMPAPKPAYMKTRPPSEFFMGMPSVLVREFISCIKGIITV